MDTTYKEMHFPQTREDLIQMVAEKKNEMEKELYHPHYVVLWEGFNTPLKGVFWQPLLPYASNYTDIKTIFGLEIIYTEKPNIIEVY